MNDNESLRLKCRSKLEDFFNLSFRLHNTFFFLEQITQNLCTKPIFYANPISLDVSNETIYEI